MGECLNNTLREFKYAVVKPIKFYNKVKNIPEYSNISYSQFRARNVSFDIFETAFLNIDNENIISIAQIRNMFRYLSNNLRGSRESSIKKTVIRIEKLNLEINRFIHSRSISNEIKYIRPRRRQSSNRKYR